MFSGTRKSQQAQTLRLKQEKFHNLALQAKQQGDPETAKKFLIAYKGLEQMITAAESGLPIDMSQVPRLPDDDTDLINDDDLTQDLAHADRDTVYRRLQEDLLRQIQLCARNQQIYAQMEGPTNLKQANEYKILEQRCSNDLEKLRQCFQHGLKPPLFHYERRQMNIIQVNHDLGENDLEVTILRGINLPVPLGHSSSSLETYVIVEFPYPTEASQIGRTRHAVGSENAEYPESLHKFYIKRNDAKFKRLMNRKELKLAVFYKPGFLRSDRPLGTATIKLAALEQTCTIHESVDLYESEHKKKIEGKLEVKLRIREALGQTKASDILPQRWLVIDRFEGVVNFIFIVFLKFYGIFF
jgi:coiled-coil and C2 domain-containing protein 1